MSLPKTEPTSGPDKKAPGGSPFAHRAARTEPARAAPTHTTATPAAQPHAQRKASRTPLIIAVTTVVIVGAAAALMLGDDAESKPTGASALQAQGTAPDSGTPAPSASAQHASLLALARESGYDRAEPAAFARALAAANDAENVGRASGQDKADALYAAASKSLAGELMAFARADAARRIATLSIADAREYRADLWAEHDRTLARADALAARSAWADAAGSARRAVITADAVVSGVRAALLRLASEMYAAGDKAAALAFHKKLARLTPAEPASVDWLMRHGKPAGATIRDPLGISFAYAPPGEFLRGSPPAEGGREADESRAKVSLARGYFMGCTEVTQFQWDAVMGAGDAAKRLAREPARFIGQDLPIVDVTWDEAALFCRKLSERTGLRYRLPTEAEWEYAARAGTDAPYGTGKLFLTVREAAVDDGTAGSPESPKPAASHGAPNAWNLHDMHGNVWEWCSDWYAPYAPGEPRDPAGPANPATRLDTATKVARGGAWCDPASAARCANRWSYNPAVRVNYIGFRAVLEFDPKLD